VTRLVAISAFQCVKSGTGSLSLSSSYIVGLDTVVGVHGFGLSSIVTNLAIRLLTGRVLGVGVSGGVHLKISLLVVL
jgi:hypothetical protein